VPQDSILRPLLFNFFINDLCNSISCCKFLFSLMISKFSMSLTRHMIAAYSIQSDVKSANIWCIANSVRLNTAKTHAVSYVRKRNFPSYNYQLCRATITRASSIKDRGVCLISNYISTIMSVMYFLNVLSRTR
jgi:hypothetical protein